MIHNFFKKITLFLGLFTVFLSTKTDTLALAKFNTSYQVYYKVENTGNTHVTFVVNQKNNLSVVYATEYGISLNETKISNLKVSDEGVQVTPVITKSENQTIVSFPFAKKVVGKDKVHSFTIEYDTGDIVEKNGNTWQINIPRFESDENVTEQTAILNLPTNFTQPTYIDPKPDIVNGNTYYFSSKVLGNKPISAIFGKNQFYQGTLKYYLENESNSNITKTITLLPDTAYQAVYYQEILPKPDKISNDDDGNLIAHYNLKGNQKIDILVKLVVKTDYLPNQNTQEKKLEYKEATKIWNYQDNTFSVSELKNLTSPRSIYEYVSGKLKYDYQKINRDGTVRIPASESFKNNISAICTDYADLFVTLARKAGIAAREIEGLAVSDNADLKPIADKQDVLHAWAEYYDDTKKVWVQVDPTWGSTTHGLDYFNKLDFNHIVFAIHGQNTHQPLPAGSYKKPGDKGKDLLFEAIEEVPFPVGNFEISDTQVSPTELKFSLKNPSGVYVSGKIEAEESATNLAYSQNIRIPPFSEIQIVMVSKPLGLLSSSNSEVIININGQPYRSRIIKGTAFQKISFFAGASIILGAVTLAARSLLLRKQKQRPPLHW